MITNESYRFKFNINVFILLCIFLQSLGIRFFSGIGIVFSIVIMLLSLKSLIRFKKRDWYLLSLLLLFLIINKIFNSSFDISKFVYQVILILEVFLFLRLYKNSQQLTRDFYSTLLLFFIHSLVGVAIYLLIPSLFRPVVYGNTPYLTFLNIFFLHFVQGVSRNTSLCWEPGLLQLLMNMLLFLSIKYNKSVIQLLLIITVILSTNSTAGFIILSLNYFYFLHKTYRERKSLIPILITSTLALLPISFIINNISNKIGGENTSGLARYRDYLIGFNLIKEKPILGHGLFDGKYLLTKKYVIRIEQQIFTQEYLDSVGDMSAGFTNGLLGLISWYGIPVGCLCYYYLFKNKFVNETFWGRMLFFMIVIFTLISEPITYTSFFLLFPISYFLFRNETVVRSQIKDGMLRNY